MQKRVVVHEQSESYHPKSTNSGHVAIAAVAALVVGAAGGFFTGYQMGGHTNDQGQVSQQAGMSGGPSSGMMGGGQFGMGGVGTVSAITGTSITIKDQRQDEETTYIISDTTEVTDGGNSTAVSDIEIGDTVMVQSDTDSESEDKVATSIQLNPSFGGPGGNMRGSQSDS